jgi:hypothetical protein
VELRHGTGYVVGARKGQRRENIERGRHRDEGTARHKLARSSDNHPLRWQASARVRLSFIASALTSSSFTSAFESTAVPASAL